MNRKLIETNVTAEETTITSLEVAEMVNKKHSELLKDIRRYREQLNEVNIPLVDFFRESTYIDAKGESRPCYLVTKKGCEFIAHKLTGVKGTAFTARYIERFHQMQHVIENDKMDTLLYSIGSITDSISKLVTSITESADQLNQKISNMEESYKNPYLIENKYPTAWFQKMNVKYKLLMEYLNCSRKQLYSALYKELEDTYDIDVNEIIDDYCYENRIPRDSCYTMDAIEHNKDLRNALRLIVDQYLIQYGILTEAETKNIKRRTIFDEKLEELQASN